MDEQPITNFWSIGWSEMQSSIIMLMLSLLVFVIAAAAVVRQSININENLIDIEQRCLLLPKRP
jgi:hypothetical protein